MEISHVWHTHNFLADGIIRFEKEGRYLKYYVKDGAAVDCMMNDELEGG